MANIFANGVMQPSATLGTGNLTLDAATPGYKNFGTVMAIGDTCHYSIMSVDSVGRPTGEYERGKGTYSAVNTLARTYVFESSNAGGLVNFAGASKLVMLTILAPSGAVVIADWLAALGAAALAGATFTGAVISTPVAVPYSANPVIDCALGNAFLVATLTGNATLAVPLRWTPGQTLSIRFQQDGTGGRTVSLPGNMKLSGALELGANRVTWMYVTHVGGVAYEGNWSYVPA